MSVAIAIPINNKRPVRDEMLVFGIHYRKRQFEANGTTSVTDLSSLTGQAQLGCYRYLVPNGTGLTLARDGNGLPHAFDHLFHFPTNFLMA